MMIQSMMRMGPETLFLPGQVVLVLDLVLEEHTLADLEGQRVITLQNFRYFHDISREENRFLRVIVRRYE